MKKAILLITLASTLSLVACDEQTPYYHGKEIHILEKRCDQSGCLYKVQNTDGHTPPFEVDPNRIVWKDQAFADSVKRLPGVK